MSMAKERIVTMIVHILQLSKPYLIASITTLICTVDGQVCSDFGFFCNTCTTVRLCQSGIANGISLTCPDGTYCDQTSADICTATNCTREPYPFFECEMVGHFAWAYNCSEYIRCVNTNGTLTPSLYSCPSTTVFEPNAGTCVLATSYNGVDVSTTESVTESSPTTEATTTTTEPTRTTSEATTRTTELATASESTTTTTTKAIATTSEVTITTTAATTTTTEAPFVCSGYGRFPVTSNPTCQSYHFCYTAPNGTLIQLELVCPTTTVFNPTTSKCVLPTAYICTN